MNRFLWIALTLLLMAQTAQAAETAKVQTAKSKTKTGHSLFQWSNTLVAPLAGYRVFSNPDHYGNGFVVGGQIRQIITPEISIQARAGVMRVRDEGYQNKMANPKFAAIDAVIDFTQPSKHGQWFSFVGYEKTSIEDSFHFGIGLRPKVKATFAKPSVFVHAGADIEGDIVLEKDVKSLYNFLFKK